MRKCCFTILWTLAACCALALSSFPSRAAESTLDLQEVIQFALKHNPGLRISERTIEAENQGIRAARADRMPRVDFTSGATRFRYPTPLTPIVISPPLTSLDLPDFEKTIYDGGVSFRLPLYQGGRIMRNIRISETRKALAEDNYAVTRQDLVYNLTSVYQKILQLKKLLRSNQASVTQLESHKRNVEEFLKVGTVPRLDLLKAEVELAHAGANVLLVQNNLESALELLKNLMGVDDPALTLSITEQPLASGAYPAEEEGIAVALSKRPDYRAVARKKTIAENRIGIAEGKRWPSVYGSGEYTKRAGETTDFKENWYLGARLTIPVFDGGLIRSEIDRERIELEKTKEEERSLRLAITREVKDARLAIANASDRIGVAAKAIDGAREALRVERLKYDTGAGTSTDVIDAQTALLRAETDSYQAAYDREIGFALLRKATGEYSVEREVLK